MSDHDEAFNQSTVKLYNVIIWILYATHKWYNILTPTSAVIITCTLTSPAV